MDINREEQGILLIRAREAIAAKLEERNPFYSHKMEVNHDSILYKPCGAFVTLHKTDESGKRSLRGCIGRIQSNMPLVETVRLVAAEAAFNDLRFPPLKREELPLCDIEISILSPMEPCLNPDLVKVGTHGLYLQKGNQTGVLLPQVPVEQGWNLQEYLDYICIKTGVPRKSYKAPDAKLFTFTAKVFGEK